MNVVLKFRYQFLNVLCLIYLHAMVLGIVNSISFIRARNFLLNLFVNQIAAANRYLLPMAWVWIFLHLESLKSSPWAVFWHRGLNI